MKRSQSSRPAAETAFVLGVSLIALGTAFLSKAGFGMSMVVAPAYVMAEVSGRILPGTMIYLYYGVLVLLACLIGRRFRLSFLFSFLSAVLFGLLVDLFSALLDPLAAEALIVRLLFYAMGLPISALAIAFLLHTYFPPQPPELFVKATAVRLGRDVYRIKYLFDLASLALAIGLSLLFFHRLRFVGPGTVCSTLLNGPLIGIFGHWMDQHLNTDPRFPKLAALFNEN